jgi:hypothetical protein
MLIPMGQSRRPSPRDSSVNRPALDLLLLGSPPDLRSDVAVAMSRVTADAAPCRLGDLVGRPAGRQMD